MFVKQELPELPYAYDALEPVISGEIMELHHKKHHNGYVTNFNNLVDDATEAIMDNNVPKLIALMQGLKFNGGGHINHAIFWTNLAPQSEGGGAPPTGELAAAIDKEFGSLEQLIEKFNSKAGPIQGSGWGWLGYSKEEGRLVITTCAGQDPLSTQDLVPLVGVDVWEHAYYLQYKNLRPDYLKAIWQVVNWANVAERFAEAKK